MIERLLAFFLDHLPSLTQVGLLGVPSILWAWASLRFAGLLKRQRAWPTGYTRKVFHFLILTSAAVVQVLGGLASLFVFGTATSIVIGLAVWRGDGDLLYEAIAREADAPRRSYFIASAYFATLIGGLASNLLFGPVAVVGYLVTGLGDAVGEPVGTRFGRHTYPVPSFGGVPARRSLEGSSAVFGVCIAALAIGGAWVPGVPTLEPLGLLGTAALCAVVEAVSPHGWDNATLQIVPSWILWGVS